VRFTKSVFLLAGISGVLLMAPAFFLERWAGEFDPPTVNHPEYYYGLIGVVLVFQFFYLLIATDPIRYRPVMVLGALGKGTFAATVVVLYVAGRVAPLWLGFVAFDGTWVVLFLVARADPCGKIGANSRGIDSVAADRDFRALCSLAEKLTAVS
jgi:hypothetical protein